MIERGEWRCAVTATAGGAQCVISSGALDTLVLCAGSWATVRMMVSCNISTLLRKLEP